MKIILYSIIAILFISCGGSTDIKVTGDETVENQNADQTPVARNFSKGKYNESLMGDFVLLEMDNVIAKLENISAKTQGCSEGFATSSLMPDWMSATFSYQRVRPIELSLLDRNPEVSLKLTDRYIGGAYSASRCTLQLATANQFFSKATLINDPALNSLEALLYLDMTNFNECSGAHTGRIAQWLETKNKTTDLCRHINYISSLAAGQLKEINEANRKLYLEAKTDEIFTENSTQAVYDNISVFIDKILKDNSLGQPLGLSAKCPFSGKTCPTAVEHRFSELSFEVITKNLEGIMAVYNGKTSMGAPEAKGLYQFLIANKKDDAANSFYNNITEAHALSTSLHGQSLEEIAASLDGAENKTRCTDTTIENQEVPACALYKSIKGLSDKVKKELRLALAVSKTKQIEGDSD